MKPTLVTTLSFLPWLYSDLATAFSMRWMVLLSSSCHPNSLAGKILSTLLSQLITHLSTGNAELDLTTVSAHQSRKLLHNSLQQAQTVVLSQGVEEVLHNVALVRAGNLVELLHDLLLVAGREDRGLEDGGQLGVLLEDLTQLGESLGDLLQRRSLGRSSVL